MPSWQTVILTLGGVVLGIVGGLVGGWVERRHSRGLRILEDQQRLISEAAEIIARLELLLADADPARLGLNLDREDPFGTYKTLEVEWRTALRPQLAAYALAHPDAVRERGEALVVEVWNSITATGWHLGELSPRGAAQAISWGAGEVRASAPASHRRGTSLPRVHGRGPGRF